jgi:protein MpaA
VLVVGGIHGNEPASPPIVRSLVEITPPPDFEVWLVPEMNPDGVAAGTRANAANIDLNRNFSWEWDAVDGGPAPFSEPETRAIANLIEQLRPDVVVWVHQPLHYVSSIGPTPDEYEQAWSRASGLPVRPDVTQHGGGESWTAFDRLLNSMLVEVAGWDATPEIVTTHRSAYAELIASLG